MACHFACDLTCWLLHQIIPSGQKIWQRILALPLLLWRIPPISSTPSSIYKTIILTESTLGTYLDAAALLSAIGLAGFLLPHCCHGFGGGCAALFTSSICLEFLAGWKRLWFHSFSFWEGVASILLSFFCLCTSPDWGLSGKWIVDWAAQEQESD